VTAINRVGEGPYSPFSSIIVAATVPGRPEPPIFIRATKNQIGLKLTPLVENGGSAVIQYKLYADDGNINADNFSEVTSYNGQVLEFEIQVADEPRFVVGKIYRFKVAAVNRIGEGEVSNYVRVAVADPAATLQAPTIDRQRSSKTSLFVQWTEAASSDIPVQGYRLFMIKKGGTDGYKLVYDGSLNPTTFSYEIRDLETGAYFAFYVVAVDFNTLS
jgi:hypothetical protein